jgi:DNA-binding NtrC family response regulator
MTVCELASSPGSPPAGTWQRFPGAAEFARVAARSGEPVLLCGETGCGKTHLARLIHEAGPRAGRPFVRVNCAAVPEALFEREMFGHVRGAFTDARQEGIGFMEAADGGVLFLDEVSDLSPRLQPKLLAFLEDGCFRRLGSTRELRADVQVIAATNCDLAEMVRQKQFREDLFYRFSVLRYTVAPLRERRHELPAITRELLRRLARRGADPPEVTPEAMEVLARHAWPGNVRELENALRAALAFSDGSPVHPHHLPLDVRLGGGEAVSRARPAPPRPERYAAPVDPEDEVRLIREALYAAGGNKTHAARALNMSRSTLWAKLQRHAP